MTQPETATVSALSKKSKQVTVAVGKSQLLDSAVILFYPLQYFLCLNISCWSYSRGNFTFSAFEKAMLHQL